MQSPRDFGNAHPQRVAPEAFDLQTWLAANQALLERLAGEQRRHVVDVSTPGLAVYFDRRQLTAALMNLITNARDASRLDAAVRIGAGA
jgi:signal transduction histidine kinase